MKVYVLVDYAPYEGGALHGVYSTCEKAEAAAAQIERADEPVVHAVEIDGPPAYRSSLSEGEFA